MLLGSIILALGLIILFEYFGLISGSIFSLFLGIVFVVMGIKMIIKKKKGCFCCGDKKE